MKLAQKTARIFASVLAGVMLTASAFALESVETTETLSEAGGELR